MPDLATVQATLKSIRRYSDYEVFFDELKDPAWIAPLTEHGLFKDPPAPVRKGGYVKFPLWPESRYLSRMASVAPDQVLGVLLALPETENVRVHEDAVDAANGLPPALAAQLVPQVIRWVNSPYHLLMPEKSGQLMARLAASGLLSESFQLMSALLAVQEDPRVLQREPAGTLGLRPDPVGRFHEWEYDEILRKYVPPVVSAAGMRALAILCDLLEQAVTISRTASEGGEDYSYVWRPAIENDAQNHDRGIREHLVEAVRDAAIDVVRRDASPLPDVIAALEGRRWTVFRRIALHVLEQFAGNALDLVRERLRDLALSEDIGVYHEFWLLARRVLPSLAPEEQERFLRSLVQKEERDQADALKEDTPEQRDEAMRFARAWLYRRLAVLGDALPAGWAARYGEMRNEIGPLPHPEYLAYSTGVSFVGASAPKDSTELAVMSIEDLSAYLRAWRPTGGLGGDSLEGLGQVLGGIVAAEPTRYANSAMAFANLDPTYVRHLVAGLGEARKARRAFAWPNVLKLARWVLAQPRDLPGRASPYHDLDPGWSWTRKAIADLLSLGLDGTEGSLPFELREDVWAILQPLTADPDPTPEHEAQYGGKNMDPLTLSINTVRGEAMHTVVRYALWVRRHFEQHGEEYARLQNGFDEMPEVRRVLDCHLDPVRDPSPAIRSVYGQWFPWLFLLDPVWARERTSRIFPHEDAQVALLDAAWDAYIVFGGTFDSILEVLADEYAYAIGRIGLAAIRERAGERPDHRLAEHLMIFHWRGKLPLLEPGGLLQRFYAVAPAALRGYAVGFVGRALHGEDKPPLPDAVSTRLQTLWEWRLEQTSSSPHEERSEELAEFGWWFASQKFPSEWVLSRLLAVLRITRKVDAAHLVVEALEPIASTNREQVIEAVALILEGTEESWNAAMWSENATTIIKAVLASDDTAAKEMAIDLIHLFGAKGFRDFASLLPEDRGAR